MSDLKQASAAGETSPQKNDWERCVSVGIIAFCILLLLTLLCIVVCRTLKHNPEIHRVIVTTESYPDSLKALNSINYEQADLLIKSLKSYDEQLSQKYQYLIEQKEQNNQIFSWGSLIVGIVAAVFGWFGFQSVSTIEDKAQKRADSVAKDVAKEEAKKQAEGVARDEAKSKAEEVAKEVAKRKAEEVAKEEAKIVAKEKADSVSRRIAWETTKFYLATEGADLINNLAKNNLQKDAIEVVKAKVLDDLNRIIEERMNLYLPSKQLADLEKRIDDLESSLKPEIDKAVKEAILALLEKYKKA